ncbi:hypothetical protein KDL45_01505, partial [bacterium]|nr:hypothetical protein [bacterium]
AVAPVPSAYAADNGPLAKQQDLKLAGIPGFVAKYSGANQAGEKIEIQVAYKAPTMVRLDVPSENFATFGDGSAVVQWDKASGTALKVDLTRARQVSAKASSAFKSLPYSQLLDVDTDPNVYNFFHIDLTEDAVILAVSFAAQPHEAPWLQHLAAADVAPLTHNGDIILEEGDFRHVIDSRTGMFKGVEELENGEVKRYIRLESFERTVPDESLFKTQLPAGVNVQQIPSDAAAIDAVLRSRFKAVMAKLLRADENRWASFNDADKKKIAAAVKQYWKTGFSSNPELIERLVRMVESPESRELIRAELANETHFAEFKANNDIHDDAEAKKRWPEFVAAQITRQVVQQSLSVVQQDVIAWTIGEAKVTADKLDLSDQAEDEFIRTHSEPIVDAMFETLSGPVGDKAKQVVREVQGS